MTARSRAVLAAIVALDDRHDPRPSANKIAREAAASDPSILEPVRRFGRGAVAHSWSGTAADCHRILGSLGALRRAGLVEVVYPDRASSSAWSLYYPTDAGRRVLTDA